MAGRWTASTTLAIYVLFLKDRFPEIAGHLISASVLSIPAGAVCAKLMLPETERPETADGVPRLAATDRDENAMAALARGAMDGLKLAAGIATLLIAILGLTSLIDLLLLKLSSPFADSIGGPLELYRQCAQQIDDQLESWLDVLGLEDLPTSSGAE